MKKLCCAFYFIFLSAFASAQNPVPNPGLENWNGTPLTPVSWYSNTNANNITITRVNGNTGYGAQGNVIHSDSSNTFLASNYFNIVFSSSSFIPFTLSLTPVSGGIPDHALITFTIIPQSPDSVHINFYFVIDDVELFQNLIMPGLLY